VDNAQARPTEAAIGYNGLKKNRRPEQLHEVSYVTRDRADLKIALFFERRPFGTSIPNTSQSSARVFWPKSVNRFQEDYYKLVEDS